MPYVTKISFKASSLNSSTLLLYSIFITKLLKKFYCTFSLINLPKKTKRITLLTSPHVHKKAREQFQTTKYFFLATVRIPNSSAFIFFLRTNTPKTICLRFFIKE